MHDQSNFCEPRTLRMELWSLPASWRTLSGAPLAKSESFLLQTYSAGLSSGAYAGNHST